MLESNKVDMKIELFHIRAQIEQMMGMMQQLLQTSSADGGQQEEKSGGTGRGDANNDSGGAGRAPREEGAAGARVGVTTATTAGGKVSNHNSTASDGRRPADDTGRRPEVPAGVSPMINMQRADARYSFLAGIATNNGGSGVLSSEFQRQPRVARPVLKGEKGESQTFKGKRHNRVHPGHFATQQGNPFYPAGMSAADWSTIVFTLPRRKMAWVHPTMATFFRTVP